MPQEVAILLALDPLSVRATTSPGLARRWNSQTDVLSSNIFLINRGVQSELEEHTTRTGGNPHVDELGWGDTTMVEASVARDRLRRGTPSCAEGGWRRDCKTDQYCNMMGTLTQILRVFSLARVGDAIGTWGKIERRIFRIYVYILILYGNDRGQKPLVLKVQTTPSHTKFFPNHDKKREKLDSVYRFFLAS
ncbi:hypothetical protein DFS33DRAFT_1278049 [Desarmillaria ectypa]|nr:hypothetical protein DFS33DRAFT_1278049 [Desarmillaria ectypa]